MNLFYWYYTMGEFLSTPIKEKVSEDGENEIVKYM